MSAGTTRTGRLMLPGGIARCGAGRVRGLPSTGRTPVGPADGSPGFPGGGAEAVA
jgi:hypothetical protein